MNKYQRKISKVAKEINKGGLPWSACKWAAKKRQVRLKIMY